MKKGITTFISCLIFLACNKDSGVSSADYNQNLTAGSSKKWILNEMQLGGVKITDCRIGDIYEYKADNNLIIDVVDSLCDPRIINPTRYIYGKWEFFSNNDSIKLIFSPVEIHYKIVSLANDLFEIKTDVTVTDTLGNPLGTQTFTQIFTPY